MDELELEVPDEYIRTAGYLETKEAAKQTKELLNLEDPPTCIIYPDDTALIGGRNVIIEMRTSDSKRHFGSRIRRNTGCHSFLHPKLTTIKQNTELIGEEAAITTDRCH